MNITDKRSAIMQSAAEVFSEKGLHLAKVEEIAERAGIAKGTVYLYFKGKNEIFWAVLVDHLENYFSMVQAIVESDLKPDQKLFEFINLGLHKVSNLARLAYSEMDKLNKSHYEELLTVQGRVHGLIAQVIEEGVTEGSFRNVNPSHAAFCLQGILRMHVEMELVNSPKKNWQEESKTELIYDLFLNGLRK